MGWRKSERDDRRQPTVLALAALVTVAAGAVVLILFVVSSLVGPRTTPHYGFAAVVALLLAACTIALWVTQADAVAVVGLVIEASGLLSMFASRGMEVFALVARLLLVLMLLKALEARRSRRS